MARHVLRNAPAVAVRAALESAVQLGRGGEVNSQAEMANPTKRRDSLQHACTFDARESRLRGTMRLCAVLARFYHDRCTRSVHPNPTDI
jgi:hypothetical protein